MVVLVGLTVKLLPVVPVFNKVQVAAPVGEAVGVITVELPEQIVGLDTEEMAIVGVAFTVTVADFDEVQPLRVPVTKYTVVTVGVVEVTVAPVVALKKVLGVHE